MDLLLRCLIGGVVVSLFSVLGDVIQPPTLGGTTAAAPAIALATLLLTLRAKGAAYTSGEARSMLAGAIAFFAYATAVSYVQMRWRPRAWVNAAALLTVWGVVSAALWAVWLRR